MADINVTPMVDVMLVLLIIFMVTAPLLTAAVPVDLPDAQAQPIEQQKEPVTLSLDRQGRLFNGERPVDNLDNEMLRLAARGTGANGPQIVLRADKALDYGRVMAVMAALNRAGLNRIALVTSGASG